MPESEKLLTVQTVAERLTVYRTTLWKWIKAGRFPQPIKLGPGSCRFRESDVDRWLASLAERQTGGAAAD